VRKRAEYPWQLELPPWFSAAKLTEAERRRRFCEGMFEFEEVFREGARPAPTSSTMPRLACPASRTAASRSPASTLTDAASRRSASSSSGGCRDLVALSQRRLIAPARC